MLVIRLTRKGKKNQPFFRVIVTDKRKSAKGGRAVEDLGYKNPLTKKVSLNKERVLYWISKGAQPSDTVHNLLVSEKIIEGEKVHVAKVSKKRKAEMEAKKAEEPAKAQAPAEPVKAEEKPAEEPKKEEKPETKPEEKKEEKPAEAPKQEQK